MHIPRTEQACGSGGFLRDRLVPPEGIEPSTPPLPRVCSTPELRRHGFAEPTVPHPPRSMQAPDLRPPDLRSADLRSAGWQLPAGEIDNNALKR